MTDSTSTERHSGSVAYSYVRFSTSKQELGDSLRRQVESAEEYCRKHHLQLAPVSYRDLGVSAFKRRNIKKGALAAFIEAVNAGKVAKGSRINLAYLYGRAITEKPRVARRISTTHFAPE